ncbi:MAG TPA: hypothetical protein VGR47_09045 [Terracidiphilus sp.]|nr:hypothetical protein [Terracidiphilus sp.]
MSILVEALIAAFDSNTELIWTTTGVSEVIAKFDVSGMHVATTFTETARNNWRIAFDVTSTASASESVHASIRVFSGVFQAVREFLEARQPQRVVFASKEEALGQLYEEYLRRQDTSLHQLGYRMIPPIKSSPLMEFTVEKITPSEWKDYRR